MTRTVTVERTAVASRPSPARTPIPAVAQMLAAVVRPSTFCWLARIMIAPAPRNPMPWMIPCRTRDMSGMGMSLCNGPITKSAAPTATSICVRTPASFAFISRSYPRIPPRTAASTSRTVMRVMVDMSGMSENSLTTAVQISCDTMMFPLRLLIAAQQDTIARSRHAESPARGSGQRPLTRAPRSAPCWRDRAPVRREPPPRRAV